MKTAIIIFMVFVGILVILTLTTTIFDLIKDSKNKKQVVQDIKEETIEKKDMLLEKTKNSGDQVGEVVILKEVKTLDEKYNDLTSEFKRLYDQIVVYACSKEGIKRSKNDKFEVYKVGNTKIITLKIKRDSIIAEFVIQNNDFKDLADDTKVKVKPTTTKVNVVDDDALSFVKGSIDIIYDSIPEAVIKRAVKKNS